MKPLGSGEFCKYHALGNDYIVVDGDGLGPLTAPRVRALCQRHTGIGSDGILQRVASTRADLGLRIFNPDGSEAEKSGNGLRIFARCMYERGYAAAPNFSIETAGGVVQATLALEGDTVGLITVDMGQASFARAAVGLKGPPRSAERETLRVLGQDLEVSCVSMGNPHCVRFVPALDVAELRRLGPALENHPAFLRRTNVQLARVLDRGRIDILIWERGAGETMASGSSSCAVAAAAYRLGLVAGKVTVAMPGGEIAISMDSDIRVRMTGAALPTFVGYVVI